MITLLQFRSALGLPNASSFCMKVETYLRMAGIDYQVKSIDDPRKTPKGKVPIIEDDDGTVVADSTFIVEYLEKTFAPGLDDHLSDSDRALSHILMRMMEERMYFILLYSRWVDDTGWAQTAPVFFGHLPPVVSSLVPRLVRKGMARQLHEQGTGRHTREEVYRMGAADLQALSVFLGDKPYFLGEQPSTVDATAYALLANALCDAVKTPLLDAAVSHANLVAYADRMKERYFRDWQPPGR